MPSLLIMTKPKPQKEETPPIINTPVQNNAPITISPREQPQPVVEEPEVTTTLDKNNPLVLACLDPWVTVDVLKNTLLNIKDQSLRIAIEKYIVAGK